MLFQRSSTVYFNFFYILQYYIDFHKENYDNMLRNQ